MLVSIFVILEHITYPSKRDAISRNYQKIKENTEIIGEIKSYPERYTRNNTVITNFICSCKFTGISEKYNVLVFINNYDGPELLHGYVIKLHGSIILPERATNPGQFDWQKFLYYQKIYYVFYANDVEIVKERITINTLANKFRNLLSKKITEVLGDIEKASLLESILIGRRSDLEPTITEKFAKAGVIHLLVVSGTHVGFISVVFYYLFHTLLYLPRKTSLLLLLPIVWFYTILVGGNPPAVRAATMTTSFIMCLLLRRAHNLYQALLVSFVVIFIFSPGTIFTASLQLSFLATLGIIHFMPLFSQLYPEKLPKVVRYFLNLFFISLSAQVAIYPILAFYFNKIQIISLISNMFIIPAAGINMMLGVIFSIATFIGGIILNISKFVVNISLDALLYLVNFFAAPSWATLPTPRPSYIFILWYYITLYTASLILKRNKQIFTLLPAQVIFLLLFLYKNLSYKNILQIAILDVGQGDCIVININQETLLIDAGGSYSKDIGGRILLPYLRYLGKNKIEDVFITHPHYNHYLGLLGILDEIKIENVYKNFIDSRDEQYAHLMEKLKKKDASITTIYRNWNKEYRNALTIKCFNPEVKLYHEEESIDVDNNSLVLKVEHKNFSLLICGDIRQDVQRELAKIFSHRLSSTILLFPAHGKCKINKEFFSFTRPQVVIISGRSVKEEILSEIRDKQLYITECNGAIQIFSNGERFKIRTFNKKTTKYFSSL